MSRRPLLIVIVLVAAGLLGVLVMHRPPPAPKPPPPPVAAQPSPEPTDDVVEEHQPEPARNVVRTETYFEPVDESKLTSAQAAAAAARYRKAARFPRTSRPLEDGLDPIAHSREPKVDYDAKKHPEPHLLAYPSIMSFEAPQDVVIYAEVMEVQMTRSEEGKPRRKQVRTGARSMRGILQTMDGVEIAPLAFYDDGTHGDAQPDDGFFTAVYTPDPDHPNDFRGQYQAVVQAESVKGDTLMATANFVYSVQIAHLTGQYRDSIVNGNLQIEAEVVAEEPGKIQLEGTLVTTVDAKMLGYAYADADVQPGTYWIPLIYWGLIFHDMKAPGPYSLFSAMLSTVGGDVPQESDIVPNAHTTKAYEVDDFGTQSFNDPEYLAKAAHFEEIERDRKAEGR